MDALLILSILRQDLQIFNLLPLNNLDELFAHGPVLLRDLLALVKCIDLSPLIFEKHVHFADTIN